jgi:hypothetical protein
MLFEELLAFRCNGEREREREREREEYREFEDKERERDQGIKENGRERSGKKRKKKFLR